MTKLVTLLETNDAIQEFKFDTVTDPDGTQWETLEIECNREDRGIVEDLVEENSGYESDWSETNVVNGTHRMGFVL